MPGAVVDLLGLGLASCAGLTISVLLGVASGDSFHDDDGLVGVLMLGFACILGVASLGVGAWGFVEWYRSDPPPTPRVTAVGTSAEATLLQSFGEVLADIFRSEVPQSHHPEASKRFRFRCFTKTRGELDHILSPFCGPGGG